METSQVEFKEFRVNSIRMTADEAEEFIQDESLRIDRLEKVFDFNIEKYTKKYFSIFGNTERDYDFGEIYLGVTDEGEKIGIPFQSHFSRDEIEQKIKKKIDQNISSLDVSQESRDEISSLYSLEIEEISFIPSSDFILQTWSDYLSRLFEFYKRETSTLYYQMKLVERTYKLSIARMKLNLVLSSPEKREQIADFIEENINSVSESQMNDVKKIQSDLRNPHILLEVNEEISTLKLSPSNMEYWVTFFRDTNSEKILSQPLPLISGLKRIHADVCLIDTFKIYDIIFPKKFRFFVAKIFIPTMKIRKNKEYIVYSRSVMMRGEGPFCEKCVTNEK